MNYAEKLKDKGLKVTPQRVAVLEALQKLHGHPTADEVINLVQLQHPNIAQGTVYKILDTFVEKHLVSRVKTDADVMRYDAVNENHHHLYCVDSSRIEDFYDEELNLLIESYFSKRSIPGFTIEDVKLQIIGRFDH